MKVFQYLRRAMVIMLITAISFLQVANVLAMAAMTEDGQGNAAESFSSNQVTHLQYPSWLNLPMLIKNRWRAITWFRIIRNLYIMSAWMLLQGKSSFV